MTGEVRSAWRESRRGAEAAGQGLRLRLRFHGSPFESWPWELMFDSDRREFLAQSPSTPVVRYSTPVVTPPVSPAGTPLRMLVVVAKPAGHPSLDGEREWERLCHALKDWKDRRWLNLERLSPATLEELQRKLREPCHILHIITHGEEGALILEDDHGKPERVTGVRLGSILATQRELRLVVLNACKGAVPSMIDPFAGLAQALVGAGIPAVIAMRSRIRDDAAVKLAESFYESLSLNLPVDVALTAARNAMYSRQDDLEWTTPVLYTQSPDCRLFRFPPRRRKLILGLTGVGAAILITAVGLYFFPKIPPVHTNPLPADPNLEHVAKNPPECPSPPGLSIAFVKVEPRSPLRPFCMSRFEITQRLWKMVVGKLPTRFKGDAYPVTKVLRDDTALFLAGLRAKEPGATFRLPTGAEWESAAVTGDDPRSAPFGAANCSNKEGDDGYEGPAPVGSYAANRAGLFDMLGNVSEWMSDEDGGKVIRRGGGFKNVLRNCSVDYVSRVEPTTSFEDAGFRIIRDLKR